MIERIAKTGYLVSVISYAAFWFMDLARPGFVARFFSVHIFLLSALLFGAIWAKTASESRTSPLLLWIVVLPFCFLAAVLTWNLGEGFEEFRPLLTAIAALVPAVAVSVTRT